MKKIILFAAFILILAVVPLVYSCGQVVQVTPATAGYKIYSGTDAGGQAFSFEYPDGWTPSQEVLTSDWNSGAWIVFTGPGDWENGVPVLGLWIVPKGGSRTDEASYNAAAYSDRSVSAEGGIGPGLISEIATTGAVAGLSAEGWKIA